MTGLLKRGLRTSFGLADQALIATAGLLLQVVLGRFLQPESYGAFAVSYTVLLLALGAHTAVVSEPLSVLGPGRHSQRLDVFVRGLIRWHHVLVTAATAVAAIAGALLWSLDHPMANPFLGLAVALPAFLLFHLVRRIAYTRLHPRGALLSSVGFALLLAAALALLVSTDHLNPLSAWLALAAATGLPALSHLAVSRRRGPTPDWRPVATESWSYGRWILAASGAHWLGVGLFVPATGVLLGLDDAGTFRALQNLVAPIQNLLAAATLLALPMLAGRAGRAANLSSGVAALAVWTVPPSLLYAILLTVFGRSWVELLYGQGTYSQASGLLALFAVGVALTPVTQALSVNLRAANRPRTIVRGKLAAAATTICAGLPLMAHLGLRGAVLGFVLSLAAETVTLAAVFPWKATA